MRPCICCNGPTVSLLNLRSKTGSRLSETGSSTSTVCRCLEGVPTSTRMLGAFIVCMLHGPNVHLSLVLYHNSCPASQLARNDRASNGSFFPFLSAPYLDSLCLCLAWSPQQPAFAVFFEVSWVQPQRQLLHVHLFYLATRLLRHWVWAATWENGIPCSMLVLFIYTFLCTVLYSCPVFERRCLICGTAYEQARAWLATLLCLACFVRPAHCISRLFVFLL